ncbi:MAG TPA: hypothetical protein VLR26_17120 [Frankiaceae bacterium]|nr:hypothetical protein [Frankiaceae bacterium]
MSQRRAVTKAIASRYQRASRVVTTSKAAARTRPDVRVTTEPVSTRQAAS